MRKPVAGIYPIILKPFLDLICCVDQGIVLHKIKIVIIVPREHCVEYFDVRVSRVAFLLCLKVTVYYIEL